MSVLGIVYYATGITRPPANDNRVVSQDDQQNASGGASGGNSNYNCNNPEVTEKQNFILPDGSIVQKEQVVIDAMNGSGSSTSSSSSSASSESSTIKYGDGSYVSRSSSKSQSKSSGSWQQSLSYGDFPGPASCNFSDSYSCSGSGQSQSESRQDYFYSDTFVESVFTSSFSSSSNDSCGSPGSASGAETRKEKYYAIGIETVKQGDGEVYNLTCMYSAGRTISPTPSDGQPKDTTSGPMNFGGAFGVTPEFLYGTSETTGNFAGVSLTQETKRTHYIGAYFEEDNIYTYFTETYTDVAVSYEGDSKIPITLKSVVPTSWRNYRAINPGTTNYSAFLTPERYAKNGIALFLTQSPTKGQYLAAKNTDWGTSFAISQVGIEAIEGIPPNNTGHVTVTYDMVTWNEGSKQSTVLTSEYAGPGERRFLTTKANDDAYQSLGKSETTLKYQTGHKFATDVNGYYSSTYHTNIPTTSMTTESAFNYFTSETTSIRSLFDSSTQTNWIQGAYFPTNTTSTSTSVNTSTQDNDTFLQNEPCNCTPVGEQGYWTNNGQASASGSSSGLTRGSSFPLPYIATPALFLGQNKPNPRTPLALEGVAKGLGVPLDTPFKGATHDNTWAVFGLLGIAEHARKYAGLDYYAENPGAYFIPYNGTVSNYTAGYSGNQIMSWNGSVTSVTLFYKMDGSTKTQSKASVISPSALGSITRPVYHMMGSEVPPWLNASPCASGRSTTFADGNVMVTKGEYSAITGAAPDGTPILDADGISPYLASFSKMTINKVGGGDNAMPSIQFGAAIGHDSPASAAAYYWHT